MITAWSEEVPSRFTAPRIEPIPAGVERPLWSVMIPTFNRTTYLRRTLESVLAQDPGRDKMQIEVVDNCSTTDDPEPVVRAVAGDRVIFTRNPRNVGMVRNFNRCIEQANGHLVHILHSDDYVEPTFYAVIGNLAARYQDCALFASRGFIVDETEVITGVSRLIDWMENPTHDIAPLLRAPFFLYPSVVVRRALYEQCGAFIPELVYCGDWEMWIRAVHFGGGVAHPQPLVNWRRHTNHASPTLIRSGEYIKDYLRLSDHLSRCYGEFSASALRNLAASQALDNYYRFASEGDIAAARANLKAYKDVVPFPAWAILGVLNRLVRVVRSVSRID